MKQLLSEHRWASAKSEALLIRSKSESIAACVGCVVSFDDSAHVQPVLFEMRACRLFCKTDVACTSVCRRVLNLGYAECGRNWAHLPSSVSLRPLRAMRQDKSGPINERPFLD